MYFRRQTRNDDMKTEEEGTSEAAATGKAVDEEVEEGDIIHTSIVGFA